MLRHLLLLSLLAFSAYAWGYIPEKDSLINVENAYVVNEKSIVHGSYKQTTPQWGPQKTGFFIPEQSEVNEQSSKQPEFDEEDNGRRKFVEQVSEIINEKPSEQSTFTKENFEEARPDKRASKSYENESYKQTTPQWGPQKTGFFIPEQSGGNEQSSKQPEFDNEDTRKRKFDEQVSEVINEKWLKKSINESNKQSTPQREPKFDKEDTGKRKFDKQTSEKNNEIWFKKSIFNNEKTEEARSDKRTSKSNENESDEQEFNQLRPSDHESKPSKSDAQNSKQSGSDEQKCEQSISTEESSSKQISKQAESEEQEPKQSEASEKDSRQLIFNEQSSEQAESNKKKFEKSRFTKRSSKQTESDEEKSEKSRIREQSFKQTESEQSRSNVKESNEEVSKERSQPERCNPEQIYYGEKEPRITRHRNQIFDQSEKIFTKNSMQILNEKDREELRAHSLLSPFTIMNKDLQNLHTFGRKKDLMNDESESKPKGWAFAQEINTAGIRNRLESVSLKMHEEEFEEVGSVNSKKEMKAEEDHNQTHKKSSEEVSNHLFTIVKTITRDGKKEPAVF